MDWDIRNYYEFLVRQAIQDRRLSEKLAEDPLTDLVCLTLNKLPARYIRYHVDMANYVLGEERIRMEQQVAQALDEALLFLHQHPRTE
ncbi:late competence development ComFB family protein [Ferrimonas marina]|uniref:Late competence development protein ComFB n=1 Tax=Ferrimonas marina TaxID=299255 RepID=A0A1M5RPV9_9GAMM|nr:late competence development ComFB family protein [Ferrimonas marina]SHH28249.1 Late competence development protein ComFB [Ferrimonas marina]